MDEFMIYVCPACFKTYKVKGINKHAKCPGCDMDLLDTGISQEKWNTLNKDEREEHKKRICNPAEDKSVLPEDIPDKTEDATIHKRSFFDDVEDKESSKQMIGEDISVNQIQKKRFPIILISAVMTVAVFAAAATLIIFKPGEEKKDPLSEDSNIINEEEAADISGAGTEETGEMEPISDLYEFEWQTITCGDNSTHLFCYDHDGKTCIGIFNDVGYGMGVEFCGTLQFTCLKYDEETFSNTRYNGYVGSDGEFDPEFLNTLHGCGINLDYEDLESDNAIRNIISATGGKRILSIILDVDKKFGEGYCTIWFGGTVKFEGYSSFDFTQADKGKVDEWKTDISQKKGGEYILPDSSTRILNEEDLAGLSNDELRKARNEIYARHGRRFKDAELQAYFDSKTWYSGIYEPDDFDSQFQLSDIESENMEFIKKHEF